MTWPSASLLRRLGCLALSAPVRGSAPLDIRRIRLMDMRSALASLVRAIIFLFPGDSAMAAGLCSGRAWTVVALAVLPLIVLAGAVPCVEEARQRFARARAPGPPA